METLVVLILVITAFRWLFWPRHLELRDGIADLRSRLAELESKLNTLNERLSTLSAGPVRESEERVVPKEDAAAQLSRTIVPQIGARGAAEATTAEPLPPPASSPAPEEPTVAAGAQAQPSPPSDKDDLVWRPTAEELSEFARDQNKPTVLEDVTRAESPAPIEEAPEYASSESVTSVSRKAPDGEAPEIEPATTLARTESEQPSVSEQAAPGATTAADGSVEAFLRTSAGRTVDWEAVIGSRWLNVIGIIIFVLGMALLAQYSLRQFGPAGKIALGAVTGLLLIGAGAYLDHSERYRVLGRTLVGGAWALLYFTSYAAYNIEASKVIHDPALGLGAMAVVAIGVIVYSLRYRSQLLSALAYALGFFTISLTPVNEFTLAATMILAASQLVVLIKLPIHNLVLVATVGAYLNHARWLGVAEWYAEGGGAWIYSDAAFWLSQGVLAFYWTLFTAIVVFGKPRGQRDASVQMTASVMNSVALLALASWQILVLHESYLYLLTATATLAYAGSAFAAWAVGRIDHLRFNASVGVLLLAITGPLAADPLGLDRVWLAPYWAIGSLVVVILGFKARLPLIRIEGHLLSAAAFVAAAVYLLPSDIAAAGWRTPEWWIAPLLMAIFFAQSEWLHRAAGRPGVLEEAPFAEALYSYAATTIVIVFLAKVARQDLVGAAWLGAGAVLAERARRLTDSHYLWQAGLLFLLAVVALFSVNLIEFQAFSVSETAYAPRWLVVGGSALAFYGLYWRHYDLRTNAQWPVDLLSAAGTLLLTGLIWFDVLSEHRGLAWLALGVAFLELALRLGNVALAIQAIALGVLSLLAVLALNLLPAYRATDITLELPRWLIVMGAMGAFYFVSWRLAPPRLPANLQFMGLARDASLLAGSLLIALLAWTDLPASVVSAAWALLGLIWFEFAARSGRRVLANHAYVLLAVAFVGFVAFNVLEAVPLTGPRMPAHAPHWAVLSVGIIVFEFVFWRIGWTSLAFEKRSFEDLLANLLAWGGAVLAALLIWREAQASWLAPAWIGLALLLFASGVRWSRHTLADQAYCLMGMALVALLLINVGHVRDSTAQAPDWAIIVVCAAIYYVFFWRLRPERYALYRVPIEGQLTDAFGSAATLLLAALLWSALPTQHLAFAWLVLAALLTEAGALYPRRILGVQSLLLASAAVAILTGVNLYELYRPEGGPFRLLMLAPEWVYIGGSAITLYYLAWRVTAGTSIRPATFMPETAGPLLSWAASFTLVVLFWKQFDATAVALAWGALALVLFEIGLARRRDVLLSQTHVISALVFGRLFLANMISPDVIEAAGALVTHRVLTVVPIVALFYYLYARTRDMPWHLRGRMLRVSRCYSLAAAILLFALARFELGRDWAVLGMAPLAVALLVIGDRIPDSDIRLQSYVIAAFSAARTWTTNAFLEGDWFNFSERAITMGVVVLALSACAGYAMSRSEPTLTHSYGRLTGNVRWTDTHAHRWLAILAVLVAGALFYHELPAGWVTMAWAGEGLLLIIIGLRTSERTFRICGLLALLVCLLKLVIIDIRDVDTIYRILSYIGVGLILLLTSLLYTRYRSVARQYM